MASRTGSFGRLPRAAPDLSGTIVAMLREWQNQEDSNLVNAWQKGGEVDGKKVTDEMLLAHWKQRRDGVSQQDPLWDYYNNLVQNYEFSIAESKQVLSYAQHKASDSSMVAFYTSWARKLPTDSEAYRQLMKSAAQYLDHARSAGSAGRAAARQNAYNNEFQSTYNRYERTYDATTDFLTRAALMTGILSGGSGDNTLEDLRSGDQTDDNRFLQLFDDIRTDPRLAGLKAQMVDTMKRYDPSWNINNFTYESWLKTAGSKQAGMAARAKVAVKYGDKSTAKSLGTEGAKFAAWRLKANDIDEGAVYNTAKAVFTGVASDPTATPFDIVNAASDFQFVLGDLDQKSTDPANRGQYASEMAAVSGDTTKAGRTRSEAEGSSGASVADYQTTAAAVAQAKAQVDAVNAGAAALTVGPPDSRGARHWQVLPSGQTGDPSKGTIVWKDMGGTSVPVYVPFTTITLKAGSAPDPRTGAPTANVGVQGDARMGVTAVDPTNGKQIFGVYANNGQLQWYADNPFTGGKLVENSDGSYSYEAVVDAGSVPTVASFIDPTAKTTDFMRSDRYAAAGLTFNLTDLNDRRALLRVDPAKANTFFLQQSNGDQQAAAVSMAAFANAQQQAFQIEGNANLSKIEAAQRSGSVYWNLEMQGARREFQQKAALPVTARPGEFTLAREYTPVVATATVPTTGEAEAMARQRAAAMLAPYAPVGPGFTPGWAKSMVDQTPTLRLPALIQKWTGKDVDYMGNPLTAEQARGMPNYPTIEQGPLPGTGFPGATAMPNYAPPSAGFPGATTPPPSAPPPIVPPPPPPIAPPPLVAVTPEQEAMAKSGKQGGVRL